MSASAATSPRLSPNAFLVPLPSHSRRSSYSHPQLTHRSSSQSSIHGHSLGSLLGEPRKPRFEMLEDLPGTPTVESLGLMNESAVEMTPEEPVKIVKEEVLGLPNGTGNVYTSLPPSPLQSPSKEGDLLQVVGLGSGRFASSPNLSLNTEPEQSSKSSDAIKLDRKHAQAIEFFSIWDYLKSELLSTDADHHQEMKWERVENFLLVPVAVEKIISFGFLLCLDAFLYVFTILPIRTVIALCRLLDPAVWSSILPPAIQSFVSGYRGAKWRERSLPPSSKADILRTALFVLTFLAMYRWMDSSRIYHAIRGQDTIKLYVIFNAVEIADRLLCAIGQDLLDCLFSRCTLSPAASPSQSLIVALRVAAYFSLTLVYCCAHSMTLIYYLTSLNVAINSYDNALLTLLLSNQFVEIKGSVFKKFEKDNLFQITCADIVERFQLTLMLCAIALRNLIELRGSDFSVLPKAFSSKGSNKLWAIFSPVGQVLLSEVGVDWLKHAFITKFNSIRVTVYDRFTDVLCRDLVSSRASEKHTFVDHSPLVSRRLGLAVIPLACVMLRIACQALYILHQQLQQQRDPLRWLWWLLLGVLIWLCAVASKVVLGIRLIGFALKRRAGASQREKVDEVNDFGRAPIGEGAAEQAYNAEVLEMLDKKEDDQRVVPDMVIVKEEQQAWGIRETNKGSESGGAGKKKKWKLEELNRWTMVKRIW